MQESITIKLENETICQRIRDLRDMGINITKEIIEPALLLHNDKVRFLKQDK